MVVAPTALPTLRAATNINTELCCKTSVPLEYAGDTMGPGQPHNNNYQHGSDRRLRPRSQNTCPRCKRVLAANTKCRCNLREGNGKKAATRTFKVEDTGQTYGLSVQEPSPETFSAVHGPRDVPNATSAARSAPSVEYLEMTRVPRPPFEPAWYISPSPPQARASSPQPSTSYASESMSPSPQPSTSYLDLPICDTPKREVPIVKRRLFPGASTVKGFTMVSENSGKTPAPPARPRAKSAPGAAKNGKLAERPRVLAKGKAIRQLPATSYPSKATTKRAVQKGSRAAAAEPKVLKMRFVREYQPDPETQRQSGEFSGDDGRSNVDLGSPDDASAFSPPQGEYSGGGSRTPPPPHKRSPASSQSVRGGGGAGGRHVCLQCGKSFASPGKLNQHIFTHTGERPFPCGQCSKAFSTKFKLVRHNLIHSTERRFVCAQCNRQFHRKDHLQNHAKIHSSVKLKFVCDRVGCNKEYGSANSARKHSASHAAQDGKLDCALCGRAFATTPEVLHHLKVHAGSRAVKTPADRKFRCDYCDRKFFTRKDVRRHLVVHTGNRDFLCQHCPQRFGRKDHLVRHINKSHLGGGKTKGKKRAPRRPGAVRQPPLPPASEEILGYVGLPSPDDRFKQEEPETTYESSVKVEAVPQYEVSQQREILPIFEPSPYPKHEEMNQYYANIDPEIQRFFTAESDNGQLLMHLMDSVQMSSANNNGHPLGLSEHGDMVPASHASMSSESEMMSPRTSESEPPSSMGLQLELRHSPAMAEEVLGATPADSSLSIDALLGGDNGLEPLPRFNQAFPQSPPDF